MTSEELERAIVTEKLEADKYMHPEDGAVVCAYKALPHLLKLFEYMSEYMGFEGIEQEVCCMIYAYLAECFTLIPYLPRAAECYKRAIECAVKSEDETVKGEIPEFLYNAAKNRNTIAKDNTIQGSGAEGENNAVYDACMDLIGLACSCMERQEAETLIAEAAETARRSLRHDKAEHTEEYLKLIYDMNEELESNLSSASRDSGFCHLFWAAQKMYLLKHGIKWSSPAELNPQVKLD